MPYSPSTDFVGLWRAVSGGVEKAEMPGVDFMVSALTRAGLMRTVTSQTAPVTNQSTTAWFRPANPSFSSEGSLFLWDPRLSMYVPATPELFHGGSSGGGDGGGGTDMVIISGTTPVSPTAGTEWWNGTILQLWDGVNWKTVGPAVNQAGVPIQATSLVYSLQQPTTLTVTAATWVTTPFISAPNINTMGTWDPVTYKWTPNTPGIYEVFILGNYSFTGAGTAQQQVAKNDSGSVGFGTPTDVVAFGAMAVSATASGFIQGSGIVTMNGTTDFFRHWSYVSVSPVQSMASIPTWKIFKLP